MWESREIFEENNQNGVYKNWKQTVLWRETQLDLLQKVFESVWKLLLVQISFDFASFPSKSTWIPTFGPTYDRICAS